MKQTLILAVILATRAAFAEQAATEIDPTTVFFEKHPGTNLAGNFTPKKQPAGNKFGEIRLFSDETVIHATYDESGKPEQIFLHNRTGEIVTGGVVYGKAGEDPKARYKVGDIRLEKNETLLGISTKDTGWLDRIYVINSEGEIYTGGAVLGGSTLNPHSRTYYGKVALEKNEHTLKMQLNEEGDLVALFSVDTDGVVYKDWVEPNKEKTPRRDRQGKITRTSDDVIAKIIEDKKSGTIERIYTVNKQGDLTVHDLKSRGLASEAAGGNAPKINTLPKFSEALKGASASSGVMFYISKKGEILSEDLR